jgi:hypothetical protein
MTVQPVQTSPFLHPANDHPIIHMVFPFLDFKSLVFASRTCHSMQGRVQKIPPAKLCRERTLLVSAISQAGALPPEPHVKEVTIMGEVLFTEQMALVLTKYPNANCLDLGGCQCTPESLDYYLARPWVKLVISLVLRDVLYPSYLQNLLQKLDWSRLEVLDIRKSSFQALVNDSVWLIPKLQSSSLRKLGLRVSDAWTPEFLRSLPDSIESFYVSIDSPTACEALAERLRNSKILDLELYIGYLRESGTIRRIVQEILPHFSSLRNIQFRVTIGAEINPYISELCRHLQTNQVLESIDIESLELSLEEVIQLFTALQSKPRLKTIRLIGAYKTWGDHLARMPEMSRLYLQFPESVSITLFRKITVGKTLFTRADAQRML